MENKEWKPQDFSKEKTAVALSYDPNDIAPKIVATGKGHVAEKIITSAKENAFLSGWKTGRYLIQI